MLQVIKYYVMRFTNLERRERGGGGEEEEDVVMDTLQIFAPVLGL